MVAAYKTVSKTDFKYDAQGNETQGKVFPTYGSDGEKEIIQNDYTYNALGQQTKKDVTLDSAKTRHQTAPTRKKKSLMIPLETACPLQMRMVLSQKPPMTRKLGRKKETIEAAGTEYESKDREYVSTDALKTMTLDEYGRATIDIQDKLLTIPSSARTKHPAHGQKMFMNTEQRPGKRRMTRI